MSSMNPACAHCHLELKTLKTGALAIAMDEKGEACYYSHCDVKICPECESQTLLNFGHPIMYRHNQDFDVNLQLEINTLRPWVYRIWLSLQDREQAKLLKGDLR